MSTGVVRHKILQLNIAAMKADAIHYGEYRATPRYPHPHSMGGSQHPRRCIPSSSAEVRLSDRKFFHAGSTRRGPSETTTAKNILECARPGHFIARCHADVEKSHTKALKTYLAEAHPKQELLSFVGGEFDGFHVQDYEGEPAIQEDDGEKIMMAGVCTSFWNGDTAADDTGF
jgi:hypothetical protein